MARKRPKKSRLSEDPESYEGECRVKPMTQYGIPPHIWAMFLWRLSERKKEELDSSRERCIRVV